MPQTIQSFKNRHFHTRCLLLHLVFRVSSPQKSAANTDWQSVVCECLLSCNYLKYDYLRRPQSICINVTSPVTWEL